MNQNINFKQVGFVLTTTLILSACGGSSSSESTIKHNGTTYGTVKSPYTGRIWLDRNLGAERVCESYNDTACYGDYYQWGRNADGHQKSTSDITATQPTDVNDAGSDFILADSDHTKDWASAADRDGKIRSANWSKTDGSSVCPVGFRVPTIDEVTAELLDIDSAEIENSDGAFNSFLKLPSAGNRYANSFNEGYAGVPGYINSTSIASLGYNSYAVEFTGTFAMKVAPYRAGALAVRCLKD